MQQSKAQRGGTIVGFIVGLVVGLAIAVLVALVITKAPIPFINKLGHTADKQDADVSKVFDPNRSLYAKDTQVDGAPAQVLGNVPASSAQGTPGAPSLVVSAQPVGAPINVTPVASSAQPAMQEGKPTLLQAGAFNSSDAAENMKAKLALLGFEAIIAPTTKDTTTVYRVRLGPYQHIDDLNRVRSRLAENGIDANVVPSSR